MASCKLVALFFAFAVVVAMTAQLSEARIRGDQLLHPSTFHNTPPQLPSSSGGTVPPHLSSPPPLSPPAQLTKCLTPLIGMMPCMDYLTNLTVLAPPAECCDDL
uniref:Bifunctional inhibitor/plant lipid transfer protein/seed storage helical domain-containing protein n=1 Tax=Setaria italica TaxID=4555 RepID=A0A0Q3V3R4_SETIT